MILTWSELLVKVPPVEMSIDKTEVWAFNLLPQWSKLHKSMEIIVFYINREWEPSLFKSGAIPSGMRGKSSCRFWGVCPGWRGAEPAFCDCCPSPVHWEPIWNALNFPHCCQPCLSLADQEWPRWSDRRMLQISLIT